MLPKQDIIWWFWLLTIPFLTVGLLGEQQGFVIAIALTTVQIACFYWREKQLGAFVVQVRIAYLFCLIAGLLPYMEWIIWMQLAGTSMAVLMDYCLLARLVSLLPWNRKQKLTGQLILKTIFSKPVRGSILRTNILTN